MADATSLLRKSREIRPAVELEDLAGGVGQFVVKEADKCRNVGAGVESPKNVVCANLGDSFPANRFGHPRFEKARKNCVDADVVRSMTGG